MEVSRITRLLILSFLGLFSSTFAQGTFSTSFEEFPEGTVFPFIRVRPDNFVDPSPPQPYVVSGSGFVGIEPWEGTKSLVSLKGMEIVPPSGPFTGAPIRAVSLMLIFNDPRVREISLFTSSLDQAWTLFGDAAKVGQWQHISADLSTVPFGSQFLWLAAHDGAGNAYPISVDNLTLVIPEPTTWTLFAVASALLSVCLRQRRLPIDFFAMQGASSTLLFLFFAFVEVSRSTFAQGTFATGFELYPDGTVPSFVTRAASFPSPPWPDAHVVTGSGFADVSAAEGAKSLHSELTPILVRLPDGAPISAFRLVFLADQSLLGASLDRPSAGVGGDIVGPGYFFQADLTRLGEWQEIKGTFPSPVSALRLWATAQAGGGEPVTAYFPFSIDRLELFTIPEPATWSLLAMVAGALLGVRLAQGKYR
jgi:hypothetical protein